MANGKLRAYERYSWTVLFALALLLAASSLFILAAGLDENDVEGSTGLTVEEIDGFSAGVVTYMQRLEALIGVATLGLSVFAAGNSWLGARDGGRVIWFLLGAFPGTLLLFSAVFFLHDSAGLGSFYIVVAAIAAVSWLLSYRRFASRPA